MTAPTLTEFLLARIAEDEAVARLMTCPCCARVAQQGVDARHDFFATVVARTLAECEAKRRIVEGMQPFGPLDDINAPEVLGLLALPYADHPDYDEAWRA